MNDVVRIIRYLDQNKAHGNDDASIRMIKLCGKALSRPLSLLFKTCIIHPFYSTIHLFHFLSLFQK